LYILRNDEKVRKTAYSWVEHCDWIPAVLTGVKDASCIKRSRCAAGHKLMWHREYEGLPSEEFLSKIDPLLSGLRDKLFSETYTSDKAAGVMTDEWAKILHLPKGVVVGISAFDCHMGAVGAQVEPYSLVKIIGTSTCDILIAPKEDIGNKLISGICGQVDGSVEPDMIGMEAGQSSFGDVYAWFKKVLMWSVNNGIQKTSVLNAKKKKDLIEEISDSLLVELEKQTLKTPISKNSLTAMDWFNGRRTPNANQLLKGAVMGLTLASDALRIYRSLVESTAFGAKKIVDCFVNQGIAINSVVAIGGIAQKSKFIMQTLSDVLNMPIKVVKSDQACALGAAMFASVVAGVNTIEQAKKNMGSGFNAQFSPIKENVEIYKNLYDKYQRFGDYIEVECKN
jgi:L-ribulokinase